MNDNIAATHAHAVRLLLTLAERHFPERRIVPHDTIIGVIDQIDNLTTALASPEQLRRRRNDAIRVWNAELADQLDWFFVLKM